jgi:D-alanyl-D-alanine carboxypeptidase
VRRPRRGYLQQGHTWGDVPGYDTVSAVSGDGRATVVLSVNSNIDDPVLAAEYGLIDHVMCRHA